MIFHAGFIFSLKPVPDKKPSAGRKSADLPLVKCFSVSGNQKRVSYLFCALLDSCVASARQNCAARKSVSNSSASLATVFLMSAPWFIAEYRLPDRVPIWKTAFDDLHTKFNCSRETFYCCPTIFNCSPATWNCCRTTLECSPVTQDCCPMKRDCSSATWNCSPMTWNCRSATFPCSPITSPCSPLTSDSREILSDNREIKFPTSERTFASRQIPRNSNKMQYFNKKRAQTGLAGYQDFRLVGGAGGVTVSATMKTLSAKAKISGLTLIELLVVIAVIAVLAAILLPALSGRSRQPTLILPKTENLGTNAIPVLIEFLTTNKFYPQQNATNQIRISYRNVRALQFAMQTLESMGTNAEKATPILTEYLRNGEIGSQGAAAEALANVGRNKLEIIIPILINALTNSSPIHNRGGIAGAMALLGTNYADVFLPVLADVINDKITDDANRRAIAGALAVVGKSQPEAIVPILMNTFTNTATECRDGIADALASFGNDARPAIPILLVASRSQYFPLRMHAAVAVKIIAPETPNALAPLIQDLQSPEIYVRQQSIDTLGGLGTNSYEAVPALLKCLSHSEPQTRIDATRTLNNIGITSDEYISALGMNLSCSNEYVFLETIKTLANIAGHSKAAFFTLAKASVSGEIQCPVYRDSPIFLLGQSMRTNTPDLLKGLENPDPQVRLGTLEVFNAFRTPTMRPHLVPEAVPKLRELAEKDPDPNVRIRANDMLYSQSQ
jgi:prepilin-type N-terminal cleavage/methylation domain-containing protein